MRFKDDYICIVPAARRKQAADLLARAVGPGDHFSLPYVVGLGATPTHYVTQLPCDRGRLAALQKIAAAIPGTTVERVGVQQAARHMATVTAATLTRLGMRRVAVAAVAEEPAEEP